MDKRQRDRLTTITQEAVPAMRLLFDPIVNCLLSRGILTADLVDTLCEYKPPARKGRELHLEIQHRGYGAYEAYYEVLKENGLPHIASLMEDLLDPTQLTQPLPNVSGGSGDDLPEGSPHIASQMEDLLDDTTQPTEPLPNVSGESGDELPNVSGESGDELPNVSGESGDELSNVSGESGDELPNDSGESGDELPNVSGESGDELPKVWPPPDYDPLTTRVTRINPRNPGVFIKECLRKIPYMVYPLPRGYVLIINNRNFGNVYSVHSERLSDRDGSNYDVAIMYMTMSEIGFYVDCRVNRTAKEILEDAKEAASDERSKSCFMCVILSHGAIGGFDGIRGNFVKFRDLTDVVKNRLPDTPKIFFIQACLGDERLEVIRPDNRANTGEQTSGHLYREMGHTVQDYFKNHSHHIPRSEKSDATGYSTTLQHSDIFTTAWMLDGSVSWRDTKSGSWFIQALLYVIKKWAHCDNLDQLLTKVTILMARRKTNFFAFKQLCVKISTCRKDFYFFPGLKESDIQNIQRS